MLTRMQDLKRSLLRSCARTLNRAAAILFERAARDTAEDTPEQLEWARRYLDVLAFEDTSAHLWALYPPDGYPKENHSEQAREALSLAAVILYAVPFTRQNDRFGQREPRGFSRFYKKALDRDPLAISPTSDDPNPERALHERVMRYRNRFYAHVDANAANLRPRNGYQTVQVQRVPMLRERDGRALYRLVCKLGSLASDRRASLERLLKAD